jgi:hypothetical protein
MVGRWIITTRNWTGGSSSEWPEEPIPEAAGWRPASGWTTIKGLTFWPASAVNWILSATIRAWFRPANWPISNLPQLLIIRGRIGWGNSRRYYLRFTRRNQQRWKQPSVGRRKLTCHCTKWANSVAWANRLEITRRLVARRISSCAPNTITTPSWVYTFNLERLIRLNYS